MVPFWTAVLACGGTLQSALPDAWRHLVSADSCCRKGPLLDLHGPAQSLNSSHVRDRDEHCSAVSFSGDVWKRFLLGQAKRRSVPCRCCGGPDGGMSSVLGVCSISLWFTFVKAQSFT